MRTLRGLAAAIAFLCPLAARATAGVTTESLTATGAGAAWVRKTATMTGTTTCGSATSPALLLPVNAAGSAALDLRSAFTATLKMQTSVDGVNFSADLTFYPRGGGVGVTSVTAAGSWIVTADKLAGQQFLCVYASAFTSTPTIVVQASPTPVLAADLVSGGAIEVTPKNTTTSTAPAAGVLTAATATLVSAASASLCQVTVMNRDSTIHMFCGQDASVTATIGQDVGPGDAYITMIGAAPSIYCFPASGTPAFSTQGTACP